MAVMEAGAMLVGKIGNDCLEEGPAKKGRRRSALNSKNGCGTIIKMGERIGVRSFI